MEIYKSHRIAWCDKGKCSIRAVALSGGFQWKVVNNIYEMPVLTREVNAIYRHKPSKYKQACT